jgi:hypothetical protein
MGYNILKITVPDHYQLTDMEFKRQFKNASLDPRLFNHEAH